MASEQINPRALHKVPFVENYWHITNDAYGLIGTLMYSPSEHILPWRAVYAPLLVPVVDHKIAYFRTEEEALGFLRDALFDQKRPEPPVSADV
jgi:hypothetical protein